MLTRPPIFPCDAGHALPQAGHRPWNARGADRLGVGGGVGVEAKRAHKQN